MNDFFALLPLFSIAAFGLLLLVVEAFAKERLDWEILTGSIFGVALFAAIGALFAPVDASGVTESITRYLSVDRGAFLSDALIALGGLITALAAGPYFKEHGLERVEAYFLLLFSALGGMVFARAEDLVTLFIGLEMMSLGVYALVALRRTSARAVEGAVKYFLLGSFGGAILLFGSALLYGSAGTTSLVGIREALDASDVVESLFVLGTVMLLGGLAIKVAAAPFHTWAPDAYQGAMIPVTGFMSAVVKTAAFAALVRVLAVLYVGTSLMEPSTGLPLLLGGLALLSMLVGNLGALRQENIKRLLAYSGVAHAGYLLLGVAAIFANPEANAAAVYYYLFTYAAGSALVIASLISFGSRGREAVDVGDLAGLGRRHPWLAFPMAVGMFSMLGFPPTGGFFGKLLVFRGAAEAGGIFAFLALAAILLSVVSAFYYLRVVVSLYYREPEEGQLEAIPMGSDASLSLAIGLGTLLVILLGIYPAPLVEFASLAARGLLG